MSDVIIVALISGAFSLIGIIIGTIASSKLTAYRIEQLEKKVEKHNSIVERTFVLEEKMRVANHRIDDLEQEKIYPKGA